MNSLRKKPSGRERILIAATELFIENGYEATSPQAIYSKCGLGQSSFYHHFKNKQALMEAVLERINDIIHTEIIHIERLHDSPTARIKEYLRQRQRGSKGCRMGRFMYETSAKDTAISAQLNIFLDTVHAFLERNIKLAQSEKTIKQMISPSDLANLIISQTQGAYLLSRTRQDDEVLPQQLTCLQELLF
ncbi:MAG: TetR/AcrR family transcriptional regulator [Arenicella sp.]